MPRERKDSSSESDGRSSSGDDSSGSESSGSENSEQNHKRSRTRKEPSARPKGDETANLKSKQDDNAEEEKDKKQERKGKLVSDSGELSSSDGEHLPRSGPRSTVVQKVQTPSKDKSKKREDTEKISPNSSGGKDKSKHEDNETSHSKKRSHSPSPKNRDSDKRFKDERNHDRGNDRREDRRSNRDDRESEHDRSWRRDGDRRRGDDRRRDDDRRSDRSRRDAGRDRYDKRRDRDEGRRDERRSERDEDRRRDRDGRDDGDRKRDRGDRDRDRGDSRREESKRDNESQKRKKGEDAEVEKKEAAPPQKKVKDSDNLMTRTGGAYIPPAKLRMMQEQISDKTSVAYQRMAWEALKKSINGLINKVNVSNIIDIVRELFQENIVRGRGLLARSMIQAQAASPTFTHVYAALVAIINTKFPQIGDLILQRLILQFKRGFKRNDKNICLSSTRFIAHLVNQQVAHEVIALEILTLLLENVTEDSVEVAINFLKESGQKITEVSPRGVNAIFERLRTILHEGQLEKRVQYMIEVMFAIRKDGFKEHPSIISDLDLVEEDDQFTHLLQLDDVTGGQEQINVFKADDDYQQNEEKYKELKKEILDEGSTDEEGSGEESDSDDSSDDDEETEGKQDIVDQTETNMVALRRTIYLTIQSSLDFEECAHKLLKMDLKPGQEVELCYMILDCCAQLRTYEKFFGLLAQRFCQLDRKYVEPFQTIYQEQFETIHRLDTNKLRNVSKFFAHLLHTDSISWSVMNCMKLTEEDTTSASRIFIKILFLELSEYMGLPKLNKRLRDVTLQEYFEGILPRNNPKDTRFAINFFTTIGLGGLTEDLREHLKGISKQLMQQKQQQQEQELQKAAPSSSSDSSDSDSSESDSSESSESASSGSSESDSEESDSSSDSEADRKKRKKKGQKAKKSKKEKEKDRRSHADDDLRKANRHNRHKDHRPSPSAAQVNGRGADRSRIEDKLLKLSLPKGMSLVDPPDLPTGRMPSSDRRNKKGRGDKQRRKMGRRNRRLSNSERRGGRRRRNSDRDLRGSSSFEQGSDRDQGFFRGDREDLVRNRPVSPHGRRGQDGFDAGIDRRGGRRDPSPGDRRDNPDGHAMRRQDFHLSPPPLRGADRRAAASPPPRQNRRDFESSPPPRRDRMEEGASRRVYDRRDVDDLPRQMDRSHLDSPPSRYQTNQDLDSPPRTRRPREALTPPPNRGRREIESPHLDSSPPRRSGRGNVERGWEDGGRGVDRGMDRGDLDRGRDLDRVKDRVRGEMDRGRGDLERGRGEVARNLERGKGDVDRHMDRAEGGRRDVGRSVERRRGEEMERGHDRSLERGRVDFERDRGRDDMDRGRAVDRSRGGEMSGARGDMDSPPDRRDVRSPPPPSRRQANHADRDGDRRREQLHSLSPSNHKDRSRGRNEESLARRRSLSRDMEERRRPSRNDQDRAREKRRR